MFPFDKFIVLDADTEFLNSPEILYDEFDKFEAEHLFGVAKDMSHNYRLLLIEHRLLGFVCFEHCKANIIQG